MDTWDILQVRTSGDAGSVTTCVERVAEVSRYMYGRYFHLDSVEEGRNMFVHRFLVEHHYADAIRDRLGSGLFGANVIDRNVLSILRVPS